MENENLNETLSAKIRNQLGPYWNLVSLIKLYGQSKDEKILEYILKEASRFASHDKVAEQICINLNYDYKNPVSELETRGWLRIHTDDNRSGIFFSHTKPMSSDQKTKVDRYCAIHDVQYNNK